MSMMNLLKDNHNIGGNQVSLAGRSTDMGQNLVGYDPVVMFGDLVRNRKTTNIGKSL